LARVARLIGARRASSARFAAAPQASWWDRRTGHATLDSL